MSDPYAADIARPDHFGTKGEIITPGDTDLSPDFAKSLWLPAGGDLTFIPVGNADGETIAVTGLPGGTIVPFRVRRVTAASAAVIAIY